MKTEKKPYTYKNPLNSCKLILVRNYLRNETWNYDFRQHSNAAQSRRVDAANWTQANVQHV